nr:probable G-protein coupled receptor 21 [Ciona intestinalis]|eukprot:XP_002131894.1 probable G-protein coupled receptor 21 [Ciona intestinalis]
MSTTLAFARDENATTAELGNMTVPGIPNNLIPCPRMMPELVVGIILAVGIVASNLACMKLRTFTKTYKMSQHPESKYFVFNLAISNILCGTALLVTNILDIIRLLHGDISVDSCFKLCQIWAPVYIYCVMIPYVVLATLGVDIAYYCHHSMDYHRRMTPWKLRTSLASGWMYTLLVVGIAFVAHPQILCDKTRWELDIFFIIFPIFLMLLPACFVVAIFAHTIRLYWIGSKRLARHMSVYKVGPNTETKAWLVRKFVRKFAHLIVFSILCGLVYTVTTIVEVSLEFNQHKRLCILYRLDRVFISLNSLLSPWIYVLNVKKVFRRRSLSSSVRNTTLSRFGSSSRRSDRVVPTNGNPPEPRTRNGSSTHVSSTAAEMYVKSPMVLSILPKLSIPGQSPT